MYKYYLFFFIYSTEALLCSSFRRIQKGGKIFCRLSPLLRHAFKILQNFNTFSYWLVNKTEMITEFHISISQINSSGRGVKIIVGVSPKSENGGLVGWRGETVIKHFRVDAKKLGAQFLEEFFHI